VFRQFLLLSPGTSKLGFSVLKKECQMPLDDPDEDMTVDTGEHEDADESETPDLNPIEDIPAEKEL
jgi:hypothetical protein